MSALARRIAAELAERPRHFSEVVEGHADVSWRELLLAWGEVRSADVLKRDEAGRYLVRGEDHPAFRQD